MKKLTVLAALLLAVSAGTTAFAQTEYDPNEHSVNNTAQTGYQTVLITKGGKNDQVTADNIVYVDQAAANQNFQTATKFLLKYNSDDNKSVKDGLYTIRFGGGTAPATAQFAVGVGIEGYDIKLEAAGDPVQDTDGNYSWGFVTSDGGVDVSKGGIILVKVGDSVMAYPAANGLTFTGGNAMFGVQIDEVNADEEINVYFRPGADVERQTQASNPTE